MKPFEGIFVIMVTPFRDGRVDEGGMRHLVDYYVDRGVQGLVILGSNGENPYLMDEEKRRLIDISVEQAQGRVAVVIGTGCTGTNQTIALTQYARNAGADGAMITVPLYFNLGFEDVKRHFTRISDEVGFPIILYNIPSLTRLHLSPAQVAELAEIDQIIGVKETINEVDEILELIRMMKGKPFSVFSALALHLYPTVEAGGSGSFGVTQLFLPGQTLELYRAAKERDEETRDRIHGLYQKFIPLMKALPAQVAMVKEILRQMGHPITSEVRDPLPSVDDEHREMVAQVLAETGVTA